MSGIRYNGSFLRGLNIIDDFITFDKERSALLIVGVQHDFTFSATATISIPRLVTFVLLVYLSFATDISIASNDWNIFL